MNEEFAARLRRGGGSKHNLEGEGALGIDSDDSYEYLASPAPVTLSTAQNRNSLSELMSNASYETQSVGGFLISLKFFLMSQIP